MPLLRVLRTHPGPHRPACVHSEYSPVHERLCVFQRGRRRQLLGRREMTSSGGAPGRRRQVQNETHTHTQNNTQSHTNTHALTILANPSSAPFAPLCGLITVLFTLVRRVQSQTWPAGATETTQTPPISLTPRTERRSRRHRWPAPARAWAPTWRPPQVQVE